MEAQYMKFSIIESQRNKEKQTLFASRFQFPNLILSGILIGFFLFPANQVLADCGGPIVPCGGQEQPACQFCHIFVLITNIINFILTCLTPVIGGLMLIIGGLYLLTAGINPQSLNRAKSVITAAIIGIVIIFIAWILLNTLLGFMGIQEWTGLGNWWEFTGKCPIQ